MPFDCATCGATHDKLPLCFIAPAPAQTSIIPKAEWPKRIQLTSD
jgi:hypothetical protein